MTRRALAVALAVAALPATTHAQAPVASPYDIPTANTQATLPLVAALTLPHQTLGQVLRDGLRVRLIAYRGIHVSVGGSLASGMARRLHVRAKEAIPRRRYDFSRPAVYTLRLRLAHRVALKLRDAMRARLRLETALRAATGNNRTESLTAVSLLR